MCISPAGRSCRWRCVPEVLPKYGDNTTQHNTLGDRAPLLVQVSQTLNFGVRWMEGEREKEERDGGLRASTGEKERERERA